MVRTSHCERGSSVSQPPTGVLSATCLHVICDEMVTTTRPLMAHSPPEWPLMNPALPNSGSLIMYAAPFIAQQARPRSLKDTREVLPFPSPA